jgi:hypothetical protein
MMDSLALLPLLELDITEYRLHDFFIYQESILSIDNFEVLGREVLIRAGSPIPADPGIDLPGVVSYTGDQRSGSCPSSAR